MRELWEVPGTRFTRRGETVFFGRGLGVAFGVIVVLDAVLGVLAPLEIGFGVRLLGVEELYPNSSNRHRFADGV